MTPIEQIKAALEDAVRLADGVNEITASGIYKTKANDFREALTLVNQLTEGQNIPSDRQGAMAALENLKAYVFNGSLISPTPFFETIRAALAEPQVKPLEWVDYHDVNGEISSYAKTPFGKYRIASQGGVCWVRLSNKYFKFDTLEEAKAAAEAHWQSKVREVLR